MPLPLPGPEPLPISLGEALLEIVMACRSGSSRTFRNDPQLQQYFLEGVAPTGKTLGVGSYGSVVEVKILVRRSLFDDLQL